MSDATNAEASARQRARILIISFSQLASDARVLKQIRHFSRHFDVTTCGYGEAVPGVAGHIRIPDELGHAELYGRYITLHLYRAAYWRLAAMHWLRDRLRPGAFDVVLANELESMPIALRARPTRGIHLDLHEYTPLLNAEHAAWKRRIKPYHEWMCRAYGRKADSWSTVSGGLARAYLEKFGFEPRVVTNAAPFANLHPSAVSEPVRLVHSGACLRNRQIMSMLDAVDLASRPVTFDLFLTPNDPGYLGEIRERAAGIPGVTVHDPVAYADLIRTLNEFDVGVHLLAPTNFNNLWALPNKLFDYVQARLGVLVGPSPEMAERVHEFGLGRVSSAFTPEALAAEIDALTVDEVTRFKANAHANAHGLSSESQVAIWDEQVRSIIGAHGVR